MAAILNFQIFAKNAKTQICFYLLNRARYSDIVEIFDPQGISPIYSCQFCPSFRTKLILPFGWTLRLPMRPISSFLCDDWRDLSVILLIYTRPEEDYFVYRLLICGHYALPLYRNHFLRGFLKSNSQLCTSE